MNMPLNHFPIMHSTRRKCQLSHLATLLLTLTFALRVGGFNSAITNDLVCRIITSNQYACERHLVRTADNYELTLHRIPPKNSTQSLQNPPFILMHGLLGSASDFLLSGRKRSLACILHEQGYDVWLPNARGTTYSKRHLYMDSSNSSFWNFTWHEIGYYDLPAVVDYVREATAQQQVHFVAHSQGSTVFLVLLSERPEYNEKFASVSLLAPVAFLANLRSPPFRIMTAKIEEIEALLNHLGLHELFPSTALNQLGGHLLCSQDAPTQNLCLLFTFLTVGFSDYEMDRSLFPRILETTPAGISRNQLKHFGQLIRTGKFQKFDYYSKDANFRQYKQPTPPQYNLRNVRVPLQLFFGTRDLLLTKEDAIRLTKELKNTKYTLHELRGFNHIDLLYSSMAPRLVYKHIVNNVKNVTLKSGSKV
ncbi:lipase 3 isoform X1 [Zeugodacus cucurbitae]|uniref:lipase 3 isoform X1 n=1 Tax=Zeugodacus cucurbitae TaxID=28588 RepID=UPI0023D9342F|nr:lipase 3 isoform X1 [Zeugodacus cucurbitae]